MSEENPFRKASTGEVMGMKIRKAQFLNAIADERERQDEKWGKNVVGADRMIVVLWEEFGEVCRALLERDGLGLEKELIQVAAVCSKLYELLRIEGVAPGIGSTMVR